MRIGTAFDNCRLTESLAYQLSVRALDARKLVMRAALDDGAVIQNDDLIAIPDRAQAVRDYQAGAAPPAQVVVNRRLGPGVQGAGRLVENQNRRGPDERSGYFQALPLAPAEIPPPAATVLSYPPRLAAISS